MGGPEANHGRAARQDAAPPEGRPRPWALPAPFGRCDFQSGHAFLGWFDAKDGGYPIPSDSRVTTDTDRTFYAHWSDEVGISAVWNDGHVEIHVANAPEGASVEVWYTENLMGSVWSKLEASAPGVFTDDGSEGAIRVYRAKVGVTLQ